MTDKVELEQVTRVAKKYSVHAVILSDDLRGGDKKGCWMLRVFRPEAGEELHCNSSTYRKSQDPKQEKNCIAILRLIESHKTRSRRRIALQFFDL
jgi:hypothetical protein